MIQDREAFKLGRQTRDNAGFLMSAAPAAAAGEQGADPASTDPDAARTLTFSFSSELPVDRWWGTEILSHAPGAADLTRLNDGAQLLFNHDPDQVLGVIQQAWIGNDMRGYATVRFANSSDAQEKLEMVQDNILRNVSFAYEINQLLEDMDEDTYTAVQWTALEISIVSIPADQTVGIGRANDGKERPVRVLRANVETANADTTRNLNMSEQQAGAAPNAVDTKVIRDDAIKAERDRTSQILGWGEKLGQADVARQMIDGGKTVDEALAIFLEKQGMRQVPVAAEAGNLDLTDKEKQNYSIIRAISASTDGDWSKAGFELDCSKEIAKRHGKPPTKGFYMPSNITIDPMAAQRGKALVTPGQRWSPYEVGTAGSGTTGGTLVATNLLPASFIEVLRNKARVIQLGAQLLSGLIGNVSIPRRSGPASVYWVAENGAVTESEGTFDLVSLKPHTVGALSAITRQMMMQATPDIEMLVRNDMAAVMALGIDLAATQGSGTGGMPTGIINTANIGSVVGGVNGAAVTIDFLIELETAIAKANADEGAMAYLTNPSIVGALKTLKSTTGQYLWTNSPMGQRSGTPGEINGYTVARTNQVPSNLVKGTSNNCSQIIMGNWNDLLIGEWGTLEILPNPYDSAGYPAGTVLVRALQSIDLAVRHAASFAAMTDAIGQ